MPKFAAGFFEGVCGLEDQPLTFRDPPLPPWLLLMIVCQHTVPNDSRRSESLFIAPICCTGDKP